MRRLIFPVFLGIGGVAILISLGVWQLQRLEWKEGILANIDARISDTPIPLPDDRDNPELEYLPVQVSGSFSGDRLRILTSMEDVGPGFRIIERFETSEGYLILVDRGFVRDGEQSLIEGGEADIEGNLLWPDEFDNWTPAPEGDLWFARDVASMSTRLVTEPVLVVSRTVSPPDSVLTPLPIDSSSIKNDHLNYAITWFLLAAVWTVMSAAFIWRMVKPKEEGRQ